MFLFRHPEGTSPVLVLLPPSETKRSGGSGPLDPGALRHSRTLADARRRVRDALEQLSGDEEQAAKALKLGVRNRGEIARNLDLRSSGILPAIERYTGVLYDALGADALGPEARAWLDHHVLIQSALFGLVGAGDGIPAYRLSGSSRLPALGAPLKRVWSDAHAGIDWSDAEFVLDLRSKDYAALAPLPAGVGEPLAVVQRGSDGQVRALNHFNKAAKGDLVRRLALSQARVKSAEELVLWAAQEGVEMFRDPDSGALTLATALGAPGAPSSAARAAR